MEECEVKTVGTAQRLSSAPGHALTGSVKVPGDKSISHRALMLSALAIGESRAEGLLMGEDVRATAAAMRALGAKIAFDGDSATVNGVGVGGLMEPEDVLDMGNSGTSARLLSGLIASHDLYAVMTGDASLRGRPMARVTGPLSEMGARFAARSGDRLPMAIVGARDSVALDYTSPVASAQVKSAILLAGLNTRGETVVREKTHTRDHSERMLAAMGADVRTAVEDGHHVVRIQGYAELSPHHIRVPGDISSAAFPVVAASLVAGSELVLPQVGINPLRDGIVHALRAMGADIETRNPRDLGGEPVADLVVRAAELSAVVDLKVEPSTMIDEFPVLFVAAAAARGTSRFTGLAELRVKESDRLAAMAAGLEACGVAVTLFDDGIEIVGTGGDIPGGGHVRTHLDHRIAMSFAVLGQVAAKPVIIDDARPINTSFPGFVDLMRGVGARLEVAP